MKEQTAVHSAAGKAQGGIKGIMRYLMLHHQCCDISVMFQTYKYTPLAILVLAHLAEWERKVKKQDGRRVRWCSKWRAAGGRGVEPSRAVLVSQAQDASQESRPRCAVVVYRHSDHEWGRWWHAGVNITPLHRRGSSLPHGLMPRHLASNPTILWCMSLMKEKASSL